MLTVALPDVDLVRTLGVHRAGHGDPTTLVGPREAWRATHTPDGPGTLHVWREGDHVRAEAWGPGGDRLLASVPGLLGVDDDPRAVVAHHPAVARALATVRGLRIGRSGTVLHALVPTVLAQRVTAGEALRVWATLCRHLGEPAPGPAGLLLPPRPDRLLDVPTWTFHRLGVERRRADTIRRAARHARRLEEVTAMPRPDAYARLLAVPGIGPWTAASTLGPVLGDPDAVVVGDYHLPHAVAWALAGEARATDERMLELLAPYAGQRARVVRLLLAAGARAPAFGPRRPVPPIATW